LGLLAGQVHHFSATPPLASRLGAAPSQQSFGDSAAPWCPACPGNSKKRAGSVRVLPARAISTKNKHLLAIYLIPTRGFTAVLSVFRGTPPAKPLDCKIRPNRLGALSCDPWAHPTDGEPRLSRASIRFAVAGIMVQMPCFCSLTVLCLSLCGWSFHGSWSNKKPCFRLASRVGRLYSLSLWSPACHGSLRIGAVPMRLVVRQAEAEHAAAEGPFPTDRLRDRLHRPYRG
jgi:hypothetical protein